jgi:hypothetical protein
MRLIAEAQGFLANATTALLNEDYNYADTCLMFVRKNVMKIEADLAVRNDAKVREKLGLPHDMTGEPGCDGVVPLVKGGKIRALGVTGPKRNAALPEVPPVGETVQGFEVVSWFAVMAPAKFPVELVRRIDQEIQKALADPAFRDKVQADGTEIVGLGHQAFPDYLRQDLQKWKRAVELSGAKVD